MPDEGVPRHVDIGIRREVLACQAVAARRRLEMAQSVWNDIIFWVKRL